MATPLIALGSSIVAAPMLVAGLLAGGGVVAPVNNTTCSVETTSNDGTSTGTSIPISDEQAENARTIVAATKALRMPQPAAAVALMTSWQESTMLVLANPTVPESETLPHQGEGSDHDSVGLFQQRSSMGWGAVPQLMDPGYSSLAFLRALAAVPGWQQLPMWQAAQNVQRSADGLAYERWQNLGTALAAGLWDGTAGTLTCTVVSNPGGPAGAAAGMAIAYALAQLGKPYAWGGTGPDAFDCSGLVLMAYRNADIELPRTSELQWSAGPHVPFDELQPGDLVFYNPGEQVAGLPGHVGIFIGNGTIVHAPHTGDVVRLAPVLDGDEYLGAVRPVASETAS